MNIKQEFLLKLKEVEIPCRHSKQKPEEIDDETLKCIRIGQIIDQIQPTNARQSFKSSVKETLQKQCKDLIIKAINKPNVKILKSWVYVSDVRMSYSEYQWLLYATIIPKLPVDEYPQCRGILVREILDFFDLELPIYLQVKKRQANHSDQCLD